MIRNKISFEQVFFILQVFYVVLGIVCIVPFLREDLNFLYKYCLLIGLLCVFYYIVCKQRLNLTVNIFSVLIFSFVSILFIITLAHLYENGFLRNLKVSLYTIFQFYFIALISRQTSYSKAVSRLHILNMIIIFTITIISFLSLYVYFFNINGEYLIFKNTEFEFKYYYGVAFNGRLTGITSNPNDLGILSTIGIAVGILEYRNKKSTKKIYYIFTFIINYLAFLMTNSRGAEISLLAFLVFYMTFSFKSLKLRKVYKSGYILSFLLSLILALLLFASFNPARKMIGYLPRVQTSQANSSESNTIQSIAYTNLIRNTENEKSGGGRVELWHIAKDIVKDHPLVGVSVPKEAAIYYAPHLKNDRGVQSGSFHNIIIQTMVMYGLPGAIMLLLLMAILGFHGITYIKKNRHCQYTKYLISVTAILFMLVINNMVEANILYTTNHMNAIFFIYFGFFLFFINFNYKGNNINADDTYSEFNS
ncbi:O-antigen ligase family protein [Clostridium sp. AN503]|uniref:O-antigen ligase family protein n=1 Tax=Clostridium sp. AN503 TaxID=3160598 RepID=UPI003457636C